MKKNLGSLDRIVRLVLALLLFGYAIWQCSWIAALLGLFTLYESIASWCIFYQIIGKSTCKR